MSKPGIFATPEGKSYIQGATKLLAYIGFTLFLIGRFTGAGILNKISAHKVLSTYAAVNAVLMGWIADNHGMSVGFVVPAACFLVVAIYGGMWSKLSGTKSMLGVDTRGH